MKATYRPRYQVMIIVSMLTLCLGLFVDTALAQRRRRRPAGPPTLGLDQGFITLNTPDFTLKLVKASQTVAALQPKGAGGFDFTPADRLKQRAADGFYHLGDLTLRVRVGDAKAWQSLSTAAARHPVQALPASGDVLARADLGATLPQDCPLQVIRTWSLKNDRLVLSFELINKTHQPVEIGALGIPMIFNNHITRRSLSEAHETCSFFDPYMGMDGGYLQVTRLSGHGPALVVVPEGHTPFEGYQLLHEPMRPSQTFEGSFEWLVHTEAYAENEWKGVRPWNPASEATLAPGQHRTYGVRFLVSDTIEHIEQTLAAHGRPVAVCIPGTILPMDLDGKLLLQYASPVAKVQSSPAGALEVSPATNIKDHWQGRTVHGRKWGRTRLTVTYQDGLTQTIHYDVTKPAQEAMANLGHFLLTKQWFVDPNDPFKRSPSVMGYDREANHIVTQDSRVWIAGLEDEGGAGSWLAAAMKEFGQPNAWELGRYQQFVNQVLWGHIQYSQGPRQYGVRKSLFYYEPNELPAGYYNKKLNWGSWTSWRKPQAESIGRAYNYPHVVAAYWAMYRLARNNVGLVTSHPWQWYLDHAYETVRFMTKRDANGRPAVGYLNTGLMEGDIFVMLLKDLQREGWTKQAALLESRMKQRADRWNQEAYPFGSEMAWDSTGQEEVYAWCHYFGYNAKARVALDSILGYMPTLPNWGYNGNARRYWDFLYAGKLRRIERQIHHYGSGINAIPVLAEFRSHPDNNYLLRVGYGGMMGALSSIDQEGFASCAFHSFPDTLKWDAYSGDYGCNFFGHTVSTGTYIVKHPVFGWQAFGGNVKVQGDQVQVQTLDSLRKRVYIAPLGLWLTLDAGQFVSVTLDRSGSDLRLTLAPATTATPVAWLHIEQPAQVPGVDTYRPTSSLAHERDAYVVPLSAQPTTVTCKPL